MAIELTDTNFDAEIAGEQLTMVDFWAEWCGPCRAISPVVEALANDYAGQIKVGKLNVDNNPEVSIEYGITSIPCILFFKNGEVVDKQIGAVPRSLLENKIKAHL